MSAEEMHKGQDRYPTDLQALSDLMSSGVRGMGVGYQLAWLTAKYPMEYAHLGDIEISSD